VNSAGDFLRHLEGVFTVEAVGSSEIYVADIAEGAALTPGDHREMVRVAWRQWEAVGTVLEDGGARAL
jgi:hypothetical protein